MSKASVRQRMRNTQHVLKGKLKTQDPLEDLRIDEEIILKWFLEKYFMKM